MDNFSVVEKKTGHLFFKRLKEKVNCKMLGKETPFLFGSFLHLFNSKVFFFRPPFRVSCGGTSHPTPHLRDMNQAIRSSVKFAWRLKLPQKTHPKMMGIFF